MQFECRRKSRKLASWALSQRDPAHNGGVQSSLGGLVGLDAGNGGLSFMIAQREWTYATTSWAPQRRLILIPICGRCWPADSSRRARLDPPRAQPTS